MGSEEDRQETYFPASDGEDYYFEGEHLVFTAAYHRKRGYCCGSGCRHCPYGHCSVPPIKPDLDQLPDPPVDAEPDAG